MADSGYPIGIISIHALHEESDSPSRALNRFPQISIHALHEESDVVREAGGAAVGISIHALHEESDRLRVLKPLALSYFNPRSP